MTLVVDKNDPYKAQKEYKARQRAKKQRKCPGCGETKPLLDFVTAPRGETGRSYPVCCKPCYDSGYNRKDYFKRHYEENKEKYKERATNSSRKKWYGISTEDFEAMKEAQNGKCAICQQVPERTLHIDHNHTTGKIRELLCQQCNIGVGGFKEDEAVMLAAIEYLRKHNNV